MTVTVTVTVAVTVCVWVCAGWVGTGAETRAVHHAGASEVPSWVRVHLLEVPTTATGEATARLASAAPTVVDWDAACW